LTLRYQEEYSELQIGGELHLKMKKHPLLSAENDGGEVVLQHNFD
jgi:hypothetical protein